VIVSAQNLYRTNIAYLYVGSEISHKDFGWLALDHSLIERGVQEGTSCPWFASKPASVQISTT